MFIQYLSPWSSLLMPVYVCFKIIVHKLFVLPYNSSINLLKKERFIDVNQHFISVSWAF